jgi:hypothetical protein
MMQRAARCLAAAAVIATVATTGAMSSAQADTGRSPHKGNCSPAATAVGFSDALDKTTVNGTKVGGLSALAYDKRSREYVSVEDRSGTDAARLFFISGDLAAPKVTRAVALTKQDGSPYDGGNFDGEGVTVLPDGNYLVSSETEPSIFLFDRTGKQRGSLEVPARFQVAPKGEATLNGTLEGLSVSLDGQYIYASMEDTLTGDAPASGEGVFRRILVYRANGHGGYALTRQTAYKVDPGNRVAEVAAYGKDRLLVLEAAFNATTGNTVQLYAVDGVDRAPDVSAVRNLSAAPFRDILRKRLVADLVHCPTLGATSPEPQTNPLLDNYEGMQVDVSDGRRDAKIHIISDDNFNPIQVTRVLNLTANLP